MSSPVLAERQLLEPGCPGAQQMLDCAPVAFYQADATGRVVYGNASYRALFELTEDQSLEDWSQRLEPSERSRIRELWIKMCAEPRDTQLEYKLAGNGTRARCLVEKITPVRSGDSLVFIGSISEVSEFHDVRDALQRAVALLQGTFEQVPIGIGFTNRDGSLAGFNTAYREMLGYADAELEHKSVAEFTHEDDLELSSSHLQKLWNGEIKSYTVEKRYIRKDREIVWVRATATLVRDHDNQPTHCVGFLQDISAAKRADEEMEKVQKQLMIASREAGMAEIATNVLHNVGNVLNGVNVSASVVTETTRKSKSAGLSRVAAMLEEHAADLAAFLSADQKGKQVRVYLSALARDVEAERAKVLQELASLQKNIDHIKDIVSMQQNYAKLSGVTETIALPELLEDSLRMNAGALTRHSVAVKRDYQEVPEIVSQKHKILQILVNLIRNAKYACDESDRSEKLITVVLQRIDQGVRIAVRDSGVGIAPENMARLFSHGFTTRKGGHGFGLHSAALAAKELGGALYAASEGVGHGATFTLDLPLAPN